MEVPVRPLRLPSGQRGGDKLSGGRADLRGLRTGAGSVPPEDPAGREEVRRDCPDGKSRMTDKRTLTTKKRRPALREQRRPPNSSTDKITRFHYICRQSKSQEIKRFSDRFRT